MKSHIILFFALLLAAFTLSCQKQDSSPVSPEESFTLDKKGGSVEYTVKCVLDEGDRTDYNSPTVLSIPADAAKNNKFIHWEIGGINDIEPLGSVITLSGQAQLVFNKKSGKIVSFEFWIWEGGVGSQIYLTNGEVELTTPFKVPSEGEYTVEIRQDDITLYKQLRGKKVVFFGTISFGDIVFTPKS